MKRTPLARKTPLKTKAPIKRPAGTAKPPATKRARAARASKIRSSANGKACQLRLPGVCSHNNETVIAAHLRIAGTCGTSIKPSDILTVRACSDCHDVLDKKRFVSHITAADLVLYTHEAHCRTLVEYEKEGLIKHD